MEAAYRSEGSEAHQRGQIRNLTAAGLALLTKEELAVGTCLESIRFAVPAADGDALVDAAGVTVHLSPPTGDGTHYQSGVKLTELSDEEFEVVQRFVTERLRRQASAGKSDAPSPRLPLEQPVAVRYVGLFKDFVREVSSNISSTGMFIQTSEPRAPGSIFDFQFQLGDDFTLVAGRAEVMWIREKSLGKGQPAGMGVQFIELDQASASVIDQLVADHVESGNKPFDLDHDSPNKTEQDLPLAETRSVETGPVEPPVVLPVEPSEPGTEPEVDVELRLRQLEDENIRVRQDAEWEKLEHAKHVEALEKKLTDERSRVKMLGRELGRGPRLRTRHKAHHRGRESRIGAYRARRGASSSTRRATRRPGGGADRKGGAGARRSNGAVRSTKRPARNSKPPTGLETSWENVAPRSRNPWPTPKKSTPP